MKKKQTKKKVIKKSVALKASEEFVVGKHGIGYVWESFTNEFKGQTFTPNSLGKFQKLGKYFSHADEIEKELNPGKCTLGDVYALLQNPPEGTKDGWANLFLVGDKVVSVFWSVSSVGWSLHVWARGENWGDEGRVFSPGLGSQTLEPLGLEEAIRIVKKEGYLVYKPM